MPGRSWFFWPPDWLALKALPPRYLLRSEIVEESRNTLAALSRACSFARGRSTQRVSVSEAPSGLGPSPLPSVVLDLPELQDKLAELRRLGFLDAAEMSGDMSASEGVLMLRVLRKASPVMRGYLEHIEIIPQKKFSASKEGFPQLERSLATPNFDCSKIHLDLMMLGLRSLKYCGPVVTLCVSLMMTGFGAHRHLPKPRLF
jgi:hypothetical protein